MIGIKSNTTNSIPRRYLGLISFIIYFWIAVSALSWAEIIDFTPLKFKQFSARENIPPGTVNVIFNDSLGYLWIGTENGLARYDGYGVKSYSDEHGISGKEIKTIHEVPKGTLWVGTGDAGLFRYELEANQFQWEDVSVTRKEKKITPGILFIQSDKNGGLWMVTTELLLEYYNPETKERKEVQCRADGLIAFSDDEGEPESFDRINSTVIKFRRTLAETYHYALYKDRQGHIWFGLKGGLGHYNPDDGSIHGYGEQNGLQPGESVRDFYEAPDGTLWIAIETGNLKILNRESGVFNTRVDGRNAPWKGGCIYKLYGGEKNRLWVTTKHGLYLIEDVTSPDILPKDALTSEDEENKFPTPFHQSEDGKLWLTTWDAGVLLLNLEAGATAPSRHNFSAAHPTGKGGFFVSTTCEDHSGTLWIGTGTGGLFKKEDLPFSHLSTHLYQNIPGLHGNTKVNDLCMDSNHKFWIGTNDGLFRVNANLKKNTAKAYREKEGLPYHRVQVIYKDSNQKIWAGAGGLEQGEGQYTGVIQGGLSYYDKQKDRFISLPISPIPGDKHWVSRIYEDAAGTLWIGTRYSGLFSLAPKTGETEDFPLNRTSINSILQDSKGVLWIGTDDGLFKETKTGGRMFQATGIKSLIITVLYEDRDRNLWAGTAGGGLYLVDAASGEIIKRFTEKEGLPNPLINGILEDKTGILWIISGNFISRFAPRKKQVLRNFGVANGLPEDILNGRTFLESNGDFIIGGQKGHYRFSPERIIDNMMKPRLVLTGLHIFEKPVKYGAEGSPLTKPLNEIKKIELPAGQNALFFDLTVLHYKQPERNTWRYKLDTDVSKGDWIMGKHGDTIKCVNLAPGKHTLIIQGANCDGLWSDEKTVDLVLVSPFWKPWYFIPLGVILGLMIIVFFIRNDNKRLDIMVKAHTEELSKAMEHLQQTQAQLVQSEKMAALGQLNAGIAHEIKNPLNFVLNFSRHSAIAADTLGKEISEEMGHFNTTRKEVVEKNLEKLGKNLEKVQAHGKRIDSIASGMLLHSRGDKGEVRAIQLNESLKEDSELVFHSMKAADFDFNVIMEYDWDNAVGQINVVPQDFKRAVLNILTNACYAVRQRQKTAGPGYNPTISIKTEKCGTNVKIYFRDNGPGIPQNELANIFKPFFTTKPLGDGTGLGLSMAQETIERDHKGKLEVAGVEGEFTEFVITLPVNLEIRDIAKETGEKKSNRS